jgi:hypothetical protein
MSEEIPTHRELIDEVRSCLSTASSSLAKAQSIQTEVITAARAMFYALAPHMKGLPQLQGAFDRLREALTNYDGGSCPLEGSSRGARSPEVERV